MSGSRGSRSTRRPLRLLFFLHSLGYVRFFDPVIRELLERGHRVHLVFERDDHEPGEQEWLTAMERHERFSAALTQALKYDVWRHFAVGLRSATDLARYFSPGSRDAGYLFVRAEHRAPDWFRRLMRGPFAGSSRGSAAVARVLAAVEAAVPSCRRLEREISAAGPDVFVLGPHLAPGMRHSDYLKAAHALGLRTVMCVPSWDNLSSKQQIHELPDRVIVWNETQAKEAIDLHHVPRERIVVTGAQSFDLWFSWEPRPREQVCARAGLDPDRPYVLYVGGALFPAALTEAEWARRWLGEVRRHPALERVGVLFRPHPTRVAEWASVGFEDFENVAVWGPPPGQMPLDPRSRADFYDSIYHSAAVFGLNTSAMIESAVVGRSVHTMLVPEFSASQRGVFHFEYLLGVGGGLLRAAETFAQLREQLVEAVERRDATADERRRRFLEAFVRPHGLERPATPIVADTIEAVAALGTAAPRRMPLRYWAVRAPLAVYVRIRPFGRRIRFKARLVRQDLARGSSA